jgi:hypothetical protein
MAVPVVESPLKQWPARKQCCPEHVKLAWPRTSTTCDEDALVVREESERLRRAADDWADAPTESPSPCYL